MSEFITDKNIDINQWYNDLVIKGGLADYSDVRGCMVIKPYGFGLWEEMKAVLDKKFKDTGHQNAYFPIFIPKSLFELEEQNAEGFAKECAVVTHHRLKVDPNNKAKLIVDPEAKLEEELVVRPTSEAIIWNTYRNWIQSYRDLPLLINQWANVVRWEMRTKLFLRTAEFLWQEGHTAHATEAEAKAETMQMLDIYANFAEEYLALPVVKGLKTEHEKFAGAVETYCIEALMQDGKALQAGTSHFLGQNFPKAFDVKYQAEDGSEQYAWATSWGVSTRLIGALILAHADEKGLVIPPKVAPIHVVIIPMYHAKNEEQNQILTQKAKEIKDSLNKRNISVLIDTDKTKRPGFKYAAYELQGIPLRVTIGPRDLELGKLEICPRHSGEKSLIDLDHLDDEIIRVLDEIQVGIYQKALSYRENHTREVDSYDAFKSEIEKGGFVYAYWDGTTETELKIKEETKATIRCIPLDTKSNEGKCIYTQKLSSLKVLFARAH
ncbi:MAG: proline--tRNA ligase [Chitinophagales bacterium]|jgi:prolyl-tRNA synthetase|nr:proline--tRNA ligase [Chitinophagales bacterium]